MSEYILAHQMGFLLLGASGFFLAVFSTICAIYLFVKYRRVQHNLRVFFAGKDARTLEDTILAQASQIKHADHEIEELYKISNRIHDISMRGVHKVAMMRFNPFGDVGGKQSFAIALLDGKHDGLVISSLHTREGTRIYAKQVALGGAHGSDFTDEEREVIKQAIATT